MSCTQPSRRAMSDILTFSRSRNGVIMKYDTVSLRSRLSKNIYITCKENSICVRTADDSSRARRYLWSIRINVPQCVGCSCCSTLRIIRTLHRLPPTREMTDVVHYKQKTDSSSHDYYLLIGKNQATVTWSLIWSMRLQFNAVQLLLLSAGQQFVCQSSSAVCHRIPAECHAEWCNEVDTWPNRPRNRLRQ